MKIEVELFNGGYYFKIDGKDCSPQEVSDKLLHPIERKYDNNGLFSSGTEFLVEGKEIRSCFFQNFAASVDASKSKDPLIELKFRVAKIKELASNAEKTKKVWSTELS